MSYSTLMMRALFLLPLLCAGCVTSQGGVSDEGELVVIGTLKNLNFRPDNDWMVTTGSATAELRVTRVLSGRPPSRVLKIQYLAHMYWRENVEGRFRLRRSDEGIYLVCSENGGVGYVCP
ncbi:hypothetical protein [Sphingopyxis sp.]|uniref:hypothetical protein n=1 Tax=Sphingopyxis sp. TaxID=1908224 RepID=UPI003D13A441